MKSVEGRLPRAQAVQRKGQSTARDKECLYVSLYSIVANIWYNFPSCATQQQNPCETPLRDPPLRHLKKNLCETPKILRTPARQLQQSLSPA